MRFDVITIMPDMFLALQHGLVGQALRKQRWELRLHNPRQFAEDVHHTIDDRPFGGGDGMVMLAEPLTRAVSAVTDDLNAHRVVSGPVIFMSAHGTPISTGLCEELSRQAQVTVVCGRYGGVDQRFLNAKIDLEVSVGDSIFSGGELPGMALIDGVVRLLPGVLGNPESARAESFYSGLLEAPQFTRPRELAGVRVPDVLLSGHHSEVTKWRKLVSILVTRQRRPELLHHVNKLDLQEAQILYDKMSSDERAALGLHAVSGGANE
jgi:tRNA (guanine37-N1)-methyltransferase